jgi:hypothetical protein
MFKLSVIAYLASILNTPAAGKLFFNAQVSSVFSFTATSFQQTTDTVSYHQRHEFI